MIPSFTEYFNIDPSTFMKPPDSDKTKLDTSQISYIGDHFQLPIWFLSDDEKHVLSPIVAKDLELSHTESENQKCHILHNDHVHYT